VKTANFLLGLALVTAGTLAALAWLDATRPVNGDTPPPCVCDLGKFLGPECRIHEPAPGLAD
jgi:hypothetical protein